MILDIFQPRNEVGSVWMQLKKNIVRSSQCVWGNQRKQFEYKKEGCTTVQNRGGSSALILFCKLSIILLPYINVTVYSTEHIQVWIWRNLFCRSHGKKKS